MNKLKMLALTALTAATVGTGALAVAPSASAKPPSCSKLYKKFQIYSRVYELLYATGYRGTYTATGVLATLNTWGDAYVLCMRG